MSPLPVYTRTITPALNGPIHSDTPSNAPPPNAPLPTLNATSLGHPLNAAMPPSLTLTRTTASALFGTNHTDCPSNTPPAKAPSPVLETPAGQPLYAVIVMFETMGFARIAPEKSKPS
jgi:hypothetical protein